MESEKMYNIVPEADIGDQMSTDRSHPHQQKPIAQTMTSSPHDLSEGFHPTMLIETVKAQAPEFPWLPEALDNCGQGEWESRAYVGYIPRQQPNRPGSPWQFQTNILLTHTTLSRVILDILTDDRLGGIEFGI
jgi:hypothetical protein